MSEAIRQGDIPGVQLRWRRRLPVAVEDAWPWLAHRERLERWFGREARLAASVPSGAGGVDEPEGLLAVDSVDRHGAAVRERLRLRSSEPPRRWVAAIERLDSGWDAATLLTIELSTPPGAAPDGCEIMVFQQGFEQLSFSICLTEWEAYRRRWRWAFDRLAGLLATGGD